MIQILQSMKSLMMMIEELNIEHEMDEENWKNLDDFIFENMVLKKLK